jgi:predicted Zn-dependent peptidase
MLADLLGGYLSTQIREQAGAAYSVDGSVSTLPAGGAHLTVAMSVDTRRLRDALRVLHAELDALGAGRIEKGAVSQARWALATEDALDYQTGLKATSQILDAFSLGVPAGSPLDRRGRARARERPGPDPRLAPCVSSRVLSLIGDEKTIRGAM